MKTYVIPVLGIALVLGVSALALHAQSDQATVGHLHAKILGPIMSGATVPDTAPTVFTALLNIGANPPQDKGGNPDWPCFTGGSDTDCSSIPAGAIVISEPLAAAVVPYNCDGCAEIYWFVETTAKAAGGAVKVGLNVKQGSTAIFTYSANTGLTLAPSQILALWYEGVAFNSSAKAGAATISVTNTVGSIKSSSSTSILLK